MMASLGVDRSIGMEPGQLARRRLVRRARIAASACTKSARRAMRDAAASSALRRRRAGRVHPATV